MLRFQFIHFHLKLKIKHILIIIHFIITFIILEFNGVLNHILILIIIIANLKMKILFIITSINFIPLNFIHFKNVSYENFNFKISNLLHLKKVNNMNYFRSYFIIKKFLINSNKKIIKLYIKIFIID